MKKLFSFVTTLVLSINTFAQLGDSCSVAIPVAANNLCVPAPYATIDSVMWFRFVATSPRMQIVTTSPELYAMPDGLGAYSGPHIHSLTLFYGTCSGLQIVAKEWLGLVTKANEIVIDASGLIVGNIYYVRASRSKPGMFCDNTTGADVCVSTEQVVFTMCVRSINMLEVTIPPDLYSEAPSLSDAYYENQGQIADMYLNPKLDISSYTNHSSSAVYLSDTACSFVFAHNDTLATTMDTTYRVDMKLLGMIPGVHPFKTGKINGSLNYSLSYCPEGITDINGYKRVIYKDVYPFINMQFYSNCKGTKFYFVVRPGGDPNAIVLNFTGAGSLNITPAGRLQIITPLDTLMFEAHAFQPLASGMGALPPWQSAKFVSDPITPNAVRFQLQNDTMYLNRDLIIQVDRGHDMCELANDISFSFANPIETGTNPKYLEFDIMAEANNNITYFDNCLLRIEYNTFAFGSYVVSNGGVTVTKGANFNSATYIDPNTIVSDNTSSSISVPFGIDVNQSSWNRTLVTTTPQQLLHLKMEIQNCNTFSDLQFTDIAFTAGLSWYTLNANDNIFAAVVYDNTYYLNSLNQLLCPSTGPQIISFTPTVYPGTYYPGTTSTNYLLTITGSNFGNTKGNGNVYFLDADTNGIYLPLNANDFISWSDNQIQIRMPSVVDSFKINNIPKKHTPASGIFYLKTNNLDSASSISPINFPYAIKNAIDPLVLPERKIRIDLVNVNPTDSVAMIFHLDTSITNYPDPMAEVIVRKAIKAWRCEALVYFIAGNDTNSNINLTNPDGVSSIYFTNSLASGILGSNQPYLGACSDINGNKIAFQKEADIALARNQPWFFDTTGLPLPANMYDFYEVILHEVGHAASLFHKKDITAIGNDEELMYWQALLSSTSNPNRRYIGFNDQAGGLDVVTRGNALNLNTSTCINANAASLELPPGNSCASLGVHDFLTQSNFTIFPNPVNDNLTVEFEIGRNANVQFSIYDYTGKEIIRLDKKQLQKGKYQEQISTGKFVAGLYLFAVNINGQMWTIKIIKI